ncbi:hypothetical protein J3R03_003507 [Actinoplanes couchii]|uniref:Uncharacterized protein n=1 Tax=Actinoplanes couchii TaxID=403638 RepID=A0ABQ3XLW6_9ACTN|nr:hypothetical protein [Actinoplanes couchii]GID59481.1 hypothetical protein Aco03nite_078850 [Actinoplanes couchii]
MGRHRRLAGTRPNTLTCISYDLRETDDRSRRLAERFAFTLEGVLRGAVRFPDGPRDVAVYAELRSPVLSAHRTGADQLQSSASSATDA